jgi:hypothetical protein
LAAGRVAAKERGDFVAIATNGHGAPASPMRARIVVEEEAAGRISTAANGRVGTFDEEFGGGTSDGGEQPFQALLASEKLQRPDSAVRDYFIVAFRNAQNLVDRFGPRGGEGLTVHDGTKHGAERLPQAQSAEEHGIDSAWLGMKEWTQAGSAFFRDKLGINEERNELVPGEVASGRRQVNEVEGKASGKEWGGTVVREHEEGSSLNLNNMLKRLYHRTDHLPLVFWLERGIWA